VFGASPATYPEDEVFEVTPLAYGDFFDALIHYMSSFIVGAQRHERIANHRRI
jgi:hypothetical protein